MLPDSNADLPHAGSRRRISPHTASFGQIVRTIGFAAFLVGIFALAAPKPASAAPEPPAKNAKAKSAAKSTTKSTAKQAAKPAGGKTDAGFRNYIEALWPQASAAGVSRQVFDAAFAGVTFDRSVLKPAGKQAEFVKPIWSYINGAVTAQRINRGRELAARYQSLLADIEQRYGVDRHVVLAIWGMETSYGGFTGKQRVVRALASLAYAGNREDFFRKELIAALVILQQGHVSMQAMTGSWAGAMGHTQFMPSSFMKYAVDYDRDGRKDIWNDIPDALASTANYLASFGWQRGLPWGVEVTLPENFDISGHDPLEYRPFSYWASRGVRRTDGRALPGAGSAAIMLPAGRHGPAFLMTANFRVIKEYNRSNAYAMGVGHLGDRIAGAGAIARSWPTKDKPLSTRQAMDLQRHLQRLGYNVGKIDGKFGDQATGAIRAYQKKSGMIADGYPTHALLQKMQQTRR